MLFNNRKQKELYRAQQMKHIKVSLELQKKEAILLAEMNLKYMKA